MYVAFPADDQATAESFASYAGKLLRINEDGTTPRDNRGATPIISSGEAVIGGFDWQPRTGRLWLTGRDWPGRDFIGEFLAGVIGASRFETSLDPSGLAFSASDRTGGFAGDVFIATLAGRHLRRVHFRDTDPRQIAFIEPLLDGEFGRISDVVTGPDGALYVCTSNAGTTTGGAENDRLLRIRIL